MSPSRTVALARRLFLQVLRDRREMALIFLVPVVIMQLVTWVVRDSLGEIIKVGVVAEGPSDFYRPQFEDALVEAAGTPGPASVTPEAVQATTGDAAGRPAAAETRFEVVAVDAAGGTPDLRAGAVQAIFTFPKEFLPDRQSGRPGQIVVDVEGGDPGQVLQVQQGLQRSLVRVLSEIPIQLPPDCPANCADAVNVQPPEVVLRRQVGEGLELIDYYLPAIVPFLAFFFGFMMTALSFLRERTGGTLERLLASPLTRVDLVLGYFGGFLAFSMVQAAVIVGYALFVLDVPTAGGIFPVILLLVLTILTAEGFGIFFSTFAHSEFQVMQFIPMFVFPQLFVCGIIWKVANLPSFLRPVAAMFPMTYSAEAARELMVRGDLGAGYAQMGYLSLFLLLSIVLSVLAMRRRIL